MDKDIRAYYSTSAGEIETDTPPPLPARGLKVATQKKDPVQRLLTLNQEQRQVQEDTQKLSKLMEDAKADVPGALETLVDAFRKVAKTVRVKLLEPLLDGEGNALKQFGMKELSSDPAKAEKQLATLKEHMELAKQYFPKLEMKEITSADDKKIIVVLGADAEEFNAVVAAEKHMRQLRQKESTIKQAMAATQKELEANAAKAEKNENSRPASGIPAKRNNTDAISVHGW